jgi:hypothetical protein
MKMYINFLSVLIITALFSSCLGNKGNQEIELFPVKMGDKYQYIDREGQLIINPQFRQASVFRDGLALVCNAGYDSKWGFIDETGLYVINPIYKRATIFSEGLAWVVSEDGPPNAINNKGESKFTLNNAREVNLFHEGLAAFRSSKDPAYNKWGFVDLEGRVQIQPQFDKAGNFAEGLCPVSNDEGLWGYINEKGEVQINYQFESAVDFSNGKAVVSVDQKYGVIDADGKFIINPQYKYVASDGDWYAIYQDYKWGWCDSEGNIKINPQFEKISLFANNKIVAVDFGGNWGYVDRNGKIKINPQFSNASTFNDGHALVEVSYKVGLIDEEGKFILNPQFDEISSDYIEFVATGGTVFKSVDSDIY